MDSILTTIKKMLGITEEYTQFDVDLIVHINSIISRLTQMGLGDSTGFTISDKTAKWSDWITTKDLEPVKTYIYLRVKLLFDPPSNGTVAKSYEQIIKELEWCLFITVDPPFIEEVVTNI